MQEKKKSSHTQVYQSQIEEYQYEEKICKNRV